MPILGILASSFRSAAGPEGAYDSLATVTVPSGGVASITFAGIPSGYKHLQIRGIARENRAIVTGGTMKMTFNSDTAANYSVHVLYGDGTTAAAQGTANTSYSQIAYATGTSALTNNFGAFITDILDYANTSKYKTVRTLGGGDNNGAGEMDFGSSNWRSTSAITSISITGSTGANVLEYSSFALYGVK